MIDHTGIGVADVSRSATFYDAALGALGMRRVMQMPDNAGTDGVGYDFSNFIQSSGSIDIIHTPSNSIPPLQPKPEVEVDAFHAAALKAGGAETESPVCAGRITTPHLCSIQMVTTSRRSSAATEAIGLKSSDVFGLARSVPEQILRAVGVAL